MCLLCDVQSVYFLARCERLRLVYVEIIDRLSFFGFDHCFLMCFVRPVKYLFLCLLLRGKEIIRFP